MNINNIQTLNKLEQDSKEEENENENGDEEFSFKNEFNKRITINPKEIMKSTNALNDSKINNTSNINISFDNNTFSFGEDNSRLSNINNNLCNININKCENNITTNNTDTIPTQIEKLFEDNMPPMNNILYDKPIDNNCCNSNVCVNSSEVSLSSSFAYYNEDNNEKSYEINTINNGNTVSALGIDININKKNQEQQNTFNKNIGRISNNYNSMPIMIGEINTDKEINNNNEENQKKIINNNFKQESKSNIEAELNKSISNNIIYDNSYNNPCAATYEQFPNYLNKNKPLIDKQKEKEMNRQIENKIKAPSLQNNILYNSFILDNKYNIPTNDINNSHNYFKNNSQNNRSSIQICNNKRQSFSYISNFKKGGMFRYYKLNLQTKKSFDVLENFHNLNIISSNVNNNGNYAVLQVKEQFRKLNGINYILTPLTENFNYKKYDDLLDLVTALKKYSFIPYNPEIIKKINENDNSNNNSNAFAFWKNFHK